ncbi:MAG: diguanylate cyclase [bacterium]|jgi:diguanylate cyclase (GGDEF)-like protein
MKIFQDKGKTLLPRVDSIFLISRLLTVVATGWIFFFQEISQNDYYLLSILTITFAVQMLIFWYLVKNGKYDLKKPYLSIVIFDMIFVSILVHLSGGYHSDFYFLYYLTVAFSAYMLTLPVTMILTGIVSITYVYLVTPDIHPSHIVPLLLRVGFAWFLVLAISFVSDYIRRSERRLLNLFDTLNLRTSELEKSQANLEMIYENTRALAGILDVDGVIETTVHITGDLMGYPASAVLLIGPGGNFIYRGRNIAGQSNFHLKAVDSNRQELLQSTVQKGDTITIGDLSGRSDYLPLRTSSRCVMLAPMVAHGKPVGALLAESPLAGIFNQKDEKLLTVVARSAAMAIENALLHHRMEELTITDELTGIYNYRYFADKLKEEQRRAARYSLPLSLIMLDVDWFKKFNDTYGHEVGNLVLKGITAVVKKCIRDVDIFCRYGGEEFVIILPQTPQVEVARIGERIRQQIEESTFGGGGNIPDLKVTVSVGVTSFPENGKSHDEILSVVDQALYRAKGAGKNLVCVI